MVITQYGRVELDPMRVPQAASMRSGLDDSFQSRLQAAHRASEAPPRPPEPVRAKQAEAPPAEPSPEDAAAEVQEEQPAPTPAPTAKDQVDAGNQGPVATPVAIAVPDHDHDRGPRAEPQTEAGFGSASSPALPTAPAAVPGAAANAVANGAVLALSGTAPVTAAAATNQTSVANAAKTLIDPTARPNGVLPRSEVAGYRTLNAQSVNLLEQARDSVFKQIMLKLGNGGGEMRMRLEPPDLGELDLHMVVEKGGSLRLSIGAERQDVALLLQRHLDELKQTLQQNGFAIAHAEVRTQSDAAGRRDPRGSDAYAFDTAPGDDSKVADGGGHVNYINAQGLDFWV